jgi:hypothetical protein
MVNGTEIANSQPINMRSIMMAYPGFQALPKGLKQMLVESESHFFEETTFIRRDGKPATSFSDTDADRLDVGRQLSQSWNN